MTVDGQIVTELGTKADPRVNEIAVDGRPLSLPEHTVAWMLNKPAGVLSTREDDRARPTVMGFIPPELRALVYPVGRLDLMSTGLILLTNDGPLAFRLTHPSHHTPKTYLVDVAPVLSATAVQALREGVPIEDGTTAPAEVSVAAGAPQRLTIVLYEGRKRQIRRMVRAVGAEVVGLQRVAIGPLRLGELAEGQARELLPAELADLYRAVGMSP